MSLSGPLERISRRNKHPQRPDHGASIPFPNKRDQKLLGEEDDSRPRAGKVSSEPGGGACQMNIGANGRELQCPDIRYSLQNE